MIRPTFPGTARVLAGASRFVVGLQLSLALAAALLFLTALLSLRIRSRS